MIRTMSEDGLWEYNLPVAMWCYPCGQPIKEHRNPDTIAYATRIGLGGGLCESQISPQRRGDGPRS